MPFWGRKIDYIEVSMGILSKIFGAEEVVKDTVNAVSKGADKLWFTDEEKSDAALKFLKAYEPFKLTQRYLSLILVASFCILTFIGCGMLVWIGSIDPTVAGATELIQYRMTVLDKYINLVGGDLGSIVLLIGFLYFGGGAAEGVIQKVRDRI